ncbi:MULTISPECIES: riboflavin synthase [unclassified Methylophilus]|jgi:riboflavin synthase|uniref:riboflavin synthase n=1 Tax=unclassified Methylophilus TaxID=2630143 RepID=UPI0023B29B8E|nr:MULTISPECIES: riboflavin synthase [unclassified Methylophilus]MDF0377344.1 riboflavin synthase [Methylophilus sp. YYY-1]MDT7849418.1 riboflavin synthase [Methylophilus sp. VKM B-3414]BEV08622.1 riboflavin synthase [Methylophilus sp. DW102]
MFTGIIQTVGRIAEVVPHGEDCALRIEAPSLGMEDVQLGDSIAVNGVCLTVTDFNSRSFQVMVSKVTLEVTTGLSQPGPVNLEKAMRLADRLGGHLVTGHVDGIGSITALESVGECWLLKVRAPHAISKYIAKKGSLCVNGISLTVNEIQQDEVSINLIPHTMQHTMMQHAKAGDPVNLEIDVIARYVERMQAWEQE